MNTDLLNLLRAGGGQPCLDFTEGQNFVIYGAGNRGREAKKILEEQGCRILGFMDQKPSGKLFEDLPCLSTDAPLSDKWLHATVVIAIFNAENSFTPIVKLLEQKGYKKILTFYDLDSAFHGKISDFFWLTRRDYYKDHEANILDAFALLCDDVSRKTFEASLALRLSGDFAWFEGLGYHEQYFPNDVPGWWHSEADGPLRLVDCGAFDGDSIAQAMQHGAIESVAAFEPDTDNFHSLSQRFRSGKLHADSVTLWPCGVWSQTKQLMFSDGQGLGSSLTDQGNMIISCVALDDALPVFAPTLIKMDIEGAEPDALTGAYNLIEQHHPRLAVRVYHRPEHLWQIVHQLHKWDMEYKFYLRSHLPHNFDLTLYAVAD